MLAFKERGASEAGPLARLSARIWFFVVGKFFLLAVTKMSGVKGLENCNEALKKGLITQADYDAAKSAFLRVEQLTHAFSAGLLADSEMSKAKVS